MAIYNFNIVVKDQNSALVQGASLNVFDKNNTLVLTGITNSSGVLATAGTLDTLSNPHRVSVTLQGYSSYSKYYEVYQNELSYYVRLPNYSNFYAQVNDVEQFIGLGLDYFSPKTNPTDSALSKLISYNESEIDDFINTSFQPHTITEEFQDLNRNSMDYDGYVPIWPKKRPLLTKDATWKIENFDGSNYTDFVTTKTEGRGNDYYIDYNKNIIYIRPIAFGDHYLRLTYTWGKSTIPGDITKLTILKTALNLVDNDDFASNLRVGDQPLATKRQSYLDQIKRLEANLRVVKFV